jgi:hypothetical protein
MGGDEATILTVSRLTANERRQKRAKWKVIQKQQQSEHMNEDDDDDQYSNVSTTITSASKESIGMSDDKFADLLKRN